jgi:hypothetical protein
VSNESDLTLQIRTDEGDIVTIAAHRDVDLTLVNYGERYRNGAEKGRFAARLAALSVSQSFQITVEGSLSEEERADVRALLGELKPAIEGFLRTGAPVQWEQPGAEEFESLAGFQLDLSSSKELEVIRARLRTSSREVKQPPVGDAQEPAAPRSLEDLRQAILKIVERFFKEEIREERAYKIIQHALAGALGELRKESEAA